MVQSTRRMRSEYTPLSATAKSELQEAFEDTVWVKNHPQGVSCFGRRKRLLGGRSTAEQSLARQGYRRFGRRYDAQKHRTLFFWALSREAFKAGDYATHGVPGKCR
jgi:hypothetical protein